MNSFNKLSISARIARGYCVEERVCRPADIGGLSIINRQVPLVSRQVPRRVLGPEALNTHFFDGKIQYALDSIAPLIEAASSVDSKTKMTVFQLFRRKLRNPTALRSYDIIVRDFEGAGRVVISGNWDSTNRIYACDLLYAIIVQTTGVNEEEMVSLLSAQLVDMQTGLCPQGRTTRLVQCLWSLLS